MAMLSDLFDENGKPLPNADPLALARALAGMKPQTQGTAFEPVTPQQQLSNYRQLEGQQQAWQTAEGSPWKPAEPGPVAQMLSRILQSEPGQRAMLLSMFLGPGARTANPAALARAQELAATGAPREAVWKETGWFQGPDKKWRFEIDDSASSFNPQAVTATMPSRLKLAERVAVEMGENPRRLWGDVEMQKRVLAKVDETLEAARAAEKGQPLGTAFWHDELFNAYPEHANIGIARDTLMDYAGTFNDNRITFGGGQMIGGAPKSDPRSTILHELQHATQGVEGFARGGSKALGDDIYRRLAGEVEARAVQKRMDMTPEQRRARPPWMDWDIPEAQQIVRK